MFLVHGSIEKQSPYETARQNNFIVHLFYTLRKIRATFLPARRNYICIFIKFLEIISSPLSVLI